MGETVDDLLRRASAAQRLAMERALTPLDLTPAQFAALEWLQETPGLSAAEIARRERLTPPTSSVIVANLDRKGLLNRRAMSGRGRAQPLELTNIGGEKVAAGGLAVAAVRGRLTAGLDPQLQRALVAWLRRTMDFDV